MYHVSFLAEDSGAASLGGASAPSTDYEMDYDVYYVSSDGKPILSTTGHHADVLRLG